MAIILIGGEKGGSGKSTIATSIAVAHATSGAATLLVDTDRQATSYYWALQRRENEIEPPIDFIAEANTDNLGDDLMRFSEQYEQIIVDAGGIDSPQLRTGLICADVMLSPFQVSQFDVWTLQGLQHLIDHAQSARKQSNQLPLQVLAVANRISTNPTRAKKEREDASAMLADYTSLTLCNAMLSERSAFKDAASEGMSVAEYKPVDKKAIAELTELYHEVTNVIKATNQERIKKRTARTA